MPPDLVGRTIGRYQVLRKLGQGGAGAVYLAEHTVIRSRVAIKVLTGSVAASHEVYARFIREARATNTIVSAHVPRYYDFGQLEDGRAYAVMEYFEGETLATHLARGKISLGESIGILRQLAEGMCAAHAASVIHRDLKPENIFLVPRANGGHHVVILDFGIAKVLAPTETVFESTKMGMFIGTPHYCAPEQVAGTTITAATDVYSLGVIAFEMLGGRRPFEGEGLEPLSAKLSHDAPSLAELDPELPSDLVEDIATMLSRFPGARISTMRAALTRIDAWFDVWSPITIKQPTRRWTAVAIGSVLASIAGLAVGFSVHPEVRTVRRTSPPVMVPVAVQADVPAPLACPPPIVPEPVRETASAPPSKKPPPPKSKSKPSGILIADPFE